MQPKKVAQRLAAVANRSRRRVVNAVRQGEISPPVAFVEGYPMSGYDAAFRHRSAVGARFFWSLDEGTHTW
jgi:hypothetical protein